MTTEILIFLSIALDQLCEHDIPDRFNNRTIRRRQRSVAKLIAFGGELPLRPVNKVVGLNVVEGNQSLRTPDGCVITPQKEIESSQVPQHFIRANSGAILNVKREIGLGCDLAHSNMPFHQRNLRMTAPLSICSSLSGRGEQAFLCQCRDRGSPMLLVVPLRRLPSVRIAFAGSQHSHLVISAQGSTMRQITVS
jgi:hypothetical protein